jgi:hemolysin activation/secretion protein
MAWSTPLTAVSNATLTAAQWNASVRDNLLMTAPALATTAGGYFVATGANAIAQRTSDVQAVNTVQTTTNTSYTNLTTVGPQVTLTTGPKALIVMSARASNSTAGANSWASYEVTGASAISASDNYALSYDSPVSSSTIYATYATIEPSLTPGSNVFTMKYRASSGTATFSSRRLAVIPF